MYRNTFIRILCIISFLFGSIVLSAKPAYRFSLQIEGNTDSVMYLGYYLGQHRYLCDSAKASRPGRFRFEGSRTLPPGMYFFSNREGRLVEFVIYHEQPDFKFRTDEANWRRNMTVSGSKENAILCNFRREMDSYYDVLEAQKDVLDSSAFEQLRRQQYQKVDTLRMRTIERYPDAMVSRMMLASRPPLPPPDSLQGNDRYFYLVHHYFDNMPLDDDFIVRTPPEVFYDRIAEYTDRYMKGLTPELAIPLLDTLIDRSEPAPEVFKWLVHTLTEKYLQSTVMVYDEIYVHLVNRYYASGKAFWADPSWLDKELERAARWERLLVGREAPELILFDTLHVPHSLHRMPGKYTLLVFWSPTCGHCREVIPAIYKVFEQIAEEKDITAFAILSEPDDATVMKWKHFIDEFHMHSPRWVHLNGAEANVDWREVYDITSTPQIYLIDNANHRFIAKKLNADLFERICKQL